MGKIKEHIKRKLKAFILGIVRNEGVFDQVEKMEREILDVSSDIEKMEREILDVSSDIEKMEREILDIHDIIERTSQDFERLAINVRNNTAQIEKIEYLETKLSILQQKVKKQIPNIQKLDESGKVENSGNKVKIGKSESNESYEVLDYFDFENHFRGTREHIKQVQKPYLEYFKGCKTVLDIGCGRGEFLELLRSEQIEAIGIDIYEDYVEYCKTKGLVVVQDDALHYLENRNEQVDGIFIGQVVEHLELEKMVRLCNLVYEQLNDGGTVIFETPNPTSLAIYTHAFYLDPSHTKPVHPLTLKYFLEKAGFKQTEIIYTESSKIDFEIPPIKTETNEEQFNCAMQEVQRLLFGSQDYAIIARK